MFIMHSMYNTLHQTAAFDEYPVENFHFLSFSGQRTMPTDNAKKISEACNTRELSSEQKVTRAIVNRRGLQTH